MALDRFEQALAALLDQAPSDPLERIRPATRWIIFTFPCWKSILNT